MSTVLLMSDTWQPTVLRLVPFSSNNARNEDKKTMRKGQPGSRNFPVLAVTRTSANSGSRSDAKSPASHLADVPDDVSVFSETNFSVITTKTCHTDHTTASSRRRKFAKKKVPDSHSELKEAIKFSVQDLNDQTSSSSSFQSSENKDEQNEKYANVKLDNTRTKLPKPSMSVSPDAKFCSPVNGVRRSVPLTPGELELQRIRDSYYVEQVQKRKKYKLNINQLPRSTTPINDHDPDKLNMKQVIAFLQTKTPKDIPKKMVNEKRMEMSAPNTGSRSPRKVFEVTSSPSRRVMYSQDNVKSLSRPSTEVGNGDKTQSRPGTDIRNGDRSDQLENTRLIPGCISVMSTKSTPNMSFGDQPLRSGKAKSTLSVKSYKERSRDRKQLKQKPMKEFKLYRFLAIAPDGKTPGVATSFTEPTREMEASSPRKDTQYNEPHRKVVQRRSRETGTARLLHRHAINRSTSSPPKVESKELEDENETNKTIRLPVMVDGDSGALDADSDSCSTTSATCNSAKNSSKEEEERGNLPKKGKSITFDENIDVKITLKNLNQEIQQNGYPDYAVRTYKSPAFPRVNISGPRQIHVNVPQEQKKSYSQEIVRLTLRQDKTATRVTSYMSDIQNGCSTKWHDQCGEHDDDFIEASAMTSSDCNNNYENKEWLENSRQLINTISNNNFIKVRQKLKSSNMHCGGD